jgi:TatD DNase family protein
MLQTLTWVDTHCHLDAAEFDTDRDEVRLQAAQAGVTQCLFPAVEAANFDTVRLLAHRYNATRTTGHTSTTSTSCTILSDASRDVYALGIHPLYTPAASEAHLQQLDAALQQHRTDPQLVAVGEIGLDGFVPAINSPEAWDKQQHYYRAQLKLARQHQLPVVLHVRRSADALLKGLRDVPVKGGIAHAFNGSLQQAHAFIEMGFKLGFGGALTFERALQLRRLATTLPLSAIVLETDAPDIPPHWLYTPAEQRAQGVPQGRNAPAQLPRIAQVLADLRGISLAEVAHATHENAQSVLRLRE